MAKDDKRKDNSPKPAKRMPKHIGGVKLPKELRRQGDALLAKADTPEGRTMIAKGLTMAAAVATAAATKSQARSAKPVGEPAAGAVTRPPFDGDAIAQAMGNVADAVLGRMFGAKKA